MVDRLGRFGAGGLRRPLARFNLKARATHHPGNAGVIARERAFLGHINLRGDAEDPRFVGAISNVS